MSIADVSVGDRVWFSHPWTDRIVYGTVYDIFNAFYPQSPCVNARGNVHDSANSFVGSHLIPLKKCFATKEELKEFIKDSKTIKSLEQ